MRRNSPLVDTMKSNHNSDAKRQIQINKPTKFDELKISATKTPKKAVRISPMKNVDNL